MDQLRRSKVVINEGYDEPFAAHCRCACVRVCVCVISASMMLMGGNDTDANCYGG